VIWVAPVIDSLGKWLDKDFASEQGLAFRPQDPQRLGLRNILGLAAHNDRVGQIVGYMQLIRRTLLDKYPRPVQPCLIRGPPGPLHVFRLLQLHIQQQFRIARKLKSKPAVSIPWQDANPFCHSNLLNYRLPRPNSKNKRPNQRNSNGGHH
jgi:hypothetical protein